MTATLSVRGLWLYDNTLFDMMQVPDGVSKATLESELLAQCAELEVLYPDPPVLKGLIGTWSTIELPIWTKLYATTKLDYNPINNYDRTETIVHTGQTVDAETQGGADSSTSNSDITTSTAAYNVDTLTPDGGSTGYAEATTNYGRTVTTTHDINNDTTETHTVGNIGVTTTQQMIAQERESVQFNIYQHIIDSFRRRFCLLVY